MVTSYNMQDMETLPSPSILELPTFSDILSDNISLLKEIYPEYETSLEDDSFMPVLEAFAYRELHLRAMVNLKVKNMLPHYATEDDLDNFIFGFYGGITRIKGAYPYANYEFKLTDDSDLKGDEFIIIEEGEILSNANGDIGRLMHPVKLSANASLVNGKVELLEFLEQKEVVLNLINSYFHVEVESKEIFKHGSFYENDRRFLERALLSLNRFSTAGSLGSYYYQVMNADVRIDTTYVYSPSEGIVRVILDNFDEPIDDYVLNRITEILNDEKIKPLTDKIEIRRANAITVSIKAKIKLFDLGLQEEINNQIKENFSTNLKINEDLTYSDIIQRLHLAGVYGVTVEIWDERVGEAILGDIESNHDGRIIIDGVKCEFSQAKL